MPCFELTQSGAPVIGWATWPGRRQGSTRTVPSRSCVVLHIWPPRSGACRARPGRLGQIDPTHGLCLNPGTTRNLGRRPVEEPRIQPLVGDPVHQPPGPSRRPLLAMIVLEHLGGAAEPHDVVAGVRLPQKRRRLLGDLAVPAAATPILSMNKSTPARKSSRRIVSTRRRHPSGLCPPSHAGPWRRRP